MTLKQMFDYLIKHGMTPAGAAGMLGNLKAESALRANNLQNTGEKRLGMTDAEYTMAVDSGLYTNFVRDGIGYGLAQWTYWSRKQALLDFAIAEDASIGCAAMQMEFLVKELKADFKKVWDVLATTNSVREASDAVLLGFEKPADQSEKVQEKRAAYGQEIFAECASAEKVQAVEFGSARIDERGKISGGQAGDQTGNEVATQDYYMHELGWYVLRPKSDYVATVIAEAMLIACKNDNIGYDQGNRGGVVKYGTGTATKTESDCSSLVRQCIKEASGKDVGNFTTGNEADVLEKSGLFEKRKNVNGPDDLYTGDVLVTKKKGHTVVVTKGKTRATSAPAPAKKSVEEVAKDVIAGKYGNGDTRKAKLKAEGYDPAEVQAMVNKLLDTDPVYYIVQAGDTLTSIAKKYETTVAALTKLNNLANPDVIYVKQRLRVK